MEDSNIKEAQVHVRINVEYADHPEEVIAHKIARKCLKEGKIYFELYTIYY